MFHEGKDAPYRQDTKRPDGWSGEVTPPSTLPIYSLTKLPCMYVCTPYVSRTEKKKWWLNTPSAARFAGHGGDSLGLCTNLRDTDGFIASGKDSRDGNDVGEVVEHVGLETVGLAGARDEAVDGARACHVRGIVLSWLCGSRREEEQRARGRWRTHGVKEKRALDRNERTGTTHATRDLGEDRRGPPPRAGGVRYRSISTTNGDETERS